MDMPPGSMSGDSTGAFSPGKKTMTMMHMSLYWGKDAVIWFPMWPDHSLGMYIIALFSVFVLAAATELLSLLPTSRPSAVAVSQAAVHALRVALAYLVMLAVMSFNVGIFLVAVAGHAVGFFIVKVRSPATSAGGAQDLHSGCVSTPKV